MNLLDVFESYTFPQDLMKQGLYPYFHALESGQDTEVIIDGHPTIMLGSNNYLGLTSDKRTIAAAVDSRAAHRVDLARSRRRSRAWSIAMRPLATAEMSMVSDRMANPHV